MVKNGYQDDEFVMITTLWVMMMILMINNAYFDGKLMIDNG